MKRIVIVLTSLVLGLALAPQVHAATLHVDINNPSCSDINGNPYCHIQPAINAAAPGDTIQVAAGTYLENLTIRKSLTIQGAAAKRTFIARAQNGNVVSVKRGHVTITAVSIQNGIGSGIYNAAWLTLEATVVTNNTSTGIFNDDTGTLQVSNSTISNNSALFGGGLANYGDATVLNSTFYGNSTPYDCNECTDAAIRNGGTLRLNNVTISFNYSPNIAGVDNFGTASMSNTVIGEEELGLDCSGPFKSLDYVLIQTAIFCSLAGSTSHNIYGRNPSLGPLRDNGGPTPTQALNPGSPAIDAGNPGPNDGLGIDCEPTDQRGNPRTDRCDIGAYEYP